MTSKTIITYLSLYFLLNAIGFIIALNYWWTDNYTLSFLKEEVFFLGISYGFCWFGILFLTIFIIRKWFITIDNTGFISLLDTITDENLEQKIGVKNAKKFNKTLPFIAFPIMIFSTVIFIMSMNKYKTYELTNNASKEEVKVIAIKMTKKRNEYIYFEYNNKQNTVHLPNDQQLEIGDKINVIYSKNNPKIIDYQ